MLYLVPAGWMMKQGYQTPNILPVCENNHGQPFLALIGSPVVALGVQNISDNFSDYRMVGLVSMKHSFGQI